MKNNFVEAIKEPLRLMALALVSWLLSEGVGAILRAFGGQLSAEVQLVIVGMLTSLLRGLDKFLHQIAKEQPDATRNEGILGVRGLTGF